MAGDSRNRDSTAQSGEEIQAAARRKTLYYVGLFLLGWFFLASIIAGIPSVRESFESGSLSNKDFNHVLVKNDGTVPVYFAPCVDVACEDPDNEHHPADFNLITPGNAVDLKIERGDKGGLKAFGVYGDEGELRGCVSFLAGEGARAPVNAELSKVIEECNRLGDNERVAA